MKVYVVQQNDFPTAVFSSKDAAKNYCAERETSDTHLYGRPVHWRVYEFHLRKDEE